MSRVLLVVIAATMVTASAFAAATAFPSRIDLPDGFQPEGIATAGERFYVGSIASGAVYSGSLRTGKGAILVESQTGRAAIGLKADRARLFVAGGDTGKAFVYDAKTGDDIASYQLSSGGSFINDVVVTKSAAWFTDSLKPVLYRVPLGPGGRPGAQSGVQTIDLANKGDYEHQSGFNVNGIDATPNGKTLVIVQSSTGRLFTVTPAGVTRTIALGGESVSNGDGILLDGKTLYVVQNRSNAVAKIRLAANLRTGRVLRRIANPDPNVLDVPTTVADHGSRLYVVNARFNTTPTSMTKYWITQLRK